MTSVSAGGTLYIGIVNVGENFADAIWDNVVLANFAVARVRGICRPLFDMLFSRSGCRTTLDTPSYCVSEWRCKGQAGSLRCSEQRES